MQFEHNGISVSIGDAEIRRLVLERLSNAPSIIVPASAVPPIGSEWPDREGGIYAGIARGFDGQRDYHLIVGPEHPEGEVDWKTMMEWAEAKAANCFRRKEQALCFANVPELFKPVVYWSSEQHASISAYAWSQTFDYGGQDYWTKGGKFRARLVRRLSI